MSAVPAMQAASVPCRLADLDPRACRWPVSDAGLSELHLFCGKRAAATKPYCTRHYRLAYRAPPAAVILPICVETDAADIVVDRWRMVGLRLDVDGIPYQSNPRDLRVVAYNMKSPLTSSIVLSSRTEKSMFPSPFTSP